MVFTILWKSDQGIVFCYRFRSDSIQTGSRDQSLDQRGTQRMVVHKLSPGGVDEIRAFFHVA